VGSAWAWHPRRGYPSDVGIEAGFGKVDVTVFEPGMPMLGWGVFDCVPEGAAHRLFARALVLRRAGRTVAYVVVDLCFVSAALRVAVLDALAARGLDLWPSDVMLTATHTHAGPNGFSHAFFYDLSALGWSRRVFDRLVAGIADAIAEGVARLQPARLSLGRADVRGDVAINRSRAAFARNPDASGDGVDRELLALRVDDARGRPLGAVSFFALHATSIHAETRRLHPDHKGLAAAGFEAFLGGDAVALFAQGAAGDVSPNVRFDAARGVMVGARGDDEASAAYVAEAQLDATRRAWLDAAPLDGPLDARAVHVDLEERFVPPGYAGGAPARTTRAHLGVAMAAGTAEGPGPLANLPLPRRPWSTDPKVTLLAVGPSAQRRLLGAFELPVPAAGAEVGWGGLPGAVFAHLARSRGLDRAWIPTVLPVQLLRIGDLAIAALPNEPTTQAGRRLRARLERALGVRRVHVQGYANSYSGYLTTPQEYRAQRYEGAYTLFGPHTLGAYAHALDALAASLSGEPRAIEGPPLPTCTEAELESRRFSHRGARGA